MNPRRVHELMKAHFPQWDSASLEWTNVHDGIAPNLVALNQLLRDTFATDELIVEVSRGLGTMLPLPDVGAYVAEHMGKSDIRISDRGFTAYVVVARNCVAAAWHEQPTD